MDCLELKDSFEMEYFDDFFFQAGQLCRNE